MQGDAVVRHWEPLEQPVLEHRARAGAALLRRLADHHQRAAPPVAQLAQQPRRADEARHVHVVPAGVHGVNRVAQVVGHLLGAGVRQAGFLLHRQAVHVGTDEQRRPVAVLEHANESVPADTGGDLQPGIAQLGGQPLGRLGLHERQLRVGVKMFVQRNKRRQLGGDALGHSVLGRIGRLAKREAKAKRNNAGECSDFHCEIKCREHPAKRPAAQGQRHPNIYL